uniref:Uncharacterized protein n=1 Tax=Arundo donax TaxID=35708 RepID=A0A0A9A9J8_ARUDO
MHTNFGLGQTKIIHITLKNANISIDITIFTGSV